MDGLHADGVAAVGKATSAMVAVLTTEASRPRIHWDQQEPTGPTEYAALRISSAVNLLEDRAFRPLDRQDRLSLLLGHEQSFISAMREPGGPAAFDLRIVADPNRPVPIEVAILARAWGNPEESAGQGRQQLDQIVGNLQSSLPRHVIGEPIEDEGELLDFLRPFGSLDSVSSAVITKREILGTPKRPDAKVDYYFNVSPFNWVENDWTQLFSMLATTTSRIVISVGLLPIIISEGFSENLQRMATFYGRLARADSWQGGLYFGQQTLPPDSFAVDAERVFSDYSRRYVSRVFAFRVQVSAVSSVPRGLVEMLGSLASPNAAGEGSHLERDRVSAAYDIRIPRNAAEQQLALWNLNTIDFIVPPGKSEIWERPDPPPHALRALCVIGDAKDASCVFRLPAAVDGTVPGFQVRRGGFGQEESLVGDGVSIQLGRFPGGRPLRIGLKSLTKHVLVVGSTGSGKTTTVLELLRQLWLDHDRPFLVIEPVNSDADDYRRFLDEPGFESLEVITIGDEGGRPLRFNPFEVPKSVLVAEHLANLLTCFKAAFGLWEPLPSIYQEALDQTYLKAGILASERSDGESRRWPTAVEFMRAMEQVTRGLSYAGEVKSNIEAASIRRAQQLVSGVSASSFLTDQANDIGRLLDHPVILELKSLGSGDEQALMMALLLNAITEHYQAVRGATPELAHITVIEEAHRLLARPAGGRGQEDAQAKEKAAEAFANTLAENRKYGEAVVIAEQVPSKLVEDAVKNTNLKILHRLTAEEDRSYVGATMGFDESQMRFATRLTTGEALVYSDDMAEAMQISVEPGLASTVAGKVEGQAAPPFDACEACRAKCRYRGAAQAMVRDPTFVQLMQRRVRTLEKKGASNQELSAGWQSLTDDLRSRVKAFQSLPQSEPNLSDAAYCVFLHALAVRTMRFSPAWPKALARKLGISKATDHSPEPDKVTDGDA